MNQLCSVAGIFAKLLDCIFTKLNSCLGIPFSEVFLYSYIGFLYRNTGIYASPFPRTAVHRRVKAGDQILWALPGLPIMGVWSIAPALPAGTMVKPLIRESGTLVL
jgi:hypothetical protein